MITKGSVSSYIGSLVGKKKYYEGYFEYLWRNLNMGYMLHIVSLLKFLNLIIVLWLCKRCPCSREIHALIFRGLILYAFNTITVLISLALATSHTSWNVGFNFHSIKNIFYFLFYFLFNQWLFWNVELYCLISKHLGLSRYLSVIYYTSLIPLWVENILSMVLVLSNLLTYVLWPRIWSTEWGSMCTWKKCVFCYC